MATAERLRRVSDAGARLNVGSLTLPAIIVLAAALRIALWLACHPLHHDEALYGFWARLIASGQDPLLLTTWVDKPPLALYLESIAMRLFGPSEAALRLPGMIAGILTVPMLYGFARRAYGRETAIVAAGLLAVCAFAVQFSPTAFTDPLLVLFALAACWAALAGRSFLAGLAAGLAVASKQQGLLVIPLVIGLLALAQAREGSRLQLARLAAHGLLPALFGFALVFFSVTYWDSLRWAKRPSFWDRSLATYGGLHLAGIRFWPERAVSWAQPLRYLFGVTALTIGVSALAATAGVTAFRRGGREGSEVDRLLAVFAAGFLAFHLVITFQPWDRYLLPLAPVIALLAARGLAFLTPRVALWERGGARLAVVAMAAMLAWGGLSGALGAFPIGSDHGAYAGVETLAARLQELPDEDVVYYHSLGWHYDFYLFDAPQERRWWGSAWKLADDAASSVAAEPGRGQWVVLPAADMGSVEDLRYALQTRALTIAGPRQLSLGDGRAAWLYRIVALDPP